MTDRDQVPGQGLGPHRDLGDGGGLVPEAAQRRAEREQPAGRTAAGVPDGAAGRALADRLVVIEDGRIAQDGSPALVSCLDGKPPVLADVTTAAVAELGLRPGTAAWAAVTATDLEVCVPG